MSKKVCEDVFMELEILTAKITAEEIQKYQQDLEEYQDDLKIWEDSQDINLLRGEPKPTEPKHPGENTSYMKVYMNMTDTVIRDWVFEKDNAHGVNIVSASIVSVSSGQAETINIKVEQDEWLNILKTLGITIL